MPETHAETTCYGAQPHRRVNYDWPGRRDNGHQHHACYSIIYVAQKRGYMRRCVWRCLDCEAEEWHCKCSPTTSRTLHNRRSRINSLRIPLMPSRARGDGDEKRGLCTQEPQGDINVVYLRANSTSSFTSNLKIPPPNTLFSIRRL